MNNADSGGRCSGTCTHNTDRMDNNAFKQEAVIAVLERTIRRLWILCLVLITLLFVTNACWIWYENQFIDEVTTVTQDLDSDKGNATINDGVHINGKSTADGDN